MGLVDHVVEAARFDEQLAAIVDEYARAPRAAAAASKRLIARSYDAPFEEALAESETAARGVPAVTGGGARTPGLDGRSRRR